MRPSVDVIVPDAIDDPARPSGGNRYDRRICTELARAGWQVREHAVRDAWPRLGVTGQRATAEVAAALPDDALVLVDGLIAVAAARTFVEAAARLRLVLLVHGPLAADPAGRASEAAVLATARAVITTSAWTRRQLLAAYPVHPSAVRVAEPGADPHPAVGGSVDGTRLICVGPVSTAKGHDVLVAALAALAGHEWRCLCVGPLYREPAFVAELRRTAREAGLGGRLSFVGALGGARLTAAYRWADLLVHPSRAESYGMVVTEAIAWGLPVVAARTGGVPDALGHGPDGARPGLLVPPGDAGALTVALRGWFTDAGLRSRLRSTALARRATLSSWCTTTAGVAETLTLAAGG